MKLIDSQNSDVAILGSIVIRRPRYADAILGVSREVKVLPQLHSLLTLPIPNMHIVEIDKEIVTLHPQLPGEPLRSVQNLTDRTKDRLANQLGNFLKSLHEVDPTVLSEIDIPCIDQRWWMYFLDKAEQFVFPSIASTIIKALRLQIQSHIVQLPNLPCVLRHGDFGSSNILWDGQKNITGIIDFAALAWGDPGWDIAGLFVSHDSPFVKQLASTYPEVESFLERSSFYHLMFALMDAIFGAEYGDLEIFNSGLNTLNLATLQIISAQT